MPDLSLAKDTESPYFTFLYDESALPELISHVSLQGLNVLKFEFPATGSVMVYILAVVIASGNWPFIIAETDSFTVFRFL